MLDEARAEGLVTNYLFTMALKGLKVRRNWKAASALIGAYLFMHLFIYFCGGGKVSHVLLGACLLSSTPCDNPLDWAKAHPPPPKHDSTTNPPPTHTTQ